MRVQQRKSVLLAATVLAITAFASSAQAADLPNEQIVAPQEPINAVTYDWSGLYLGANLGYGFSDFDNDAGLDLDADDFFGGAVIGYNRQSGKIIYGAEADINLSTFDQNFNIGANNGSTNLDYFGTVTGRLGYVPIDRLLTYVEGGYAFGKSELDLAGVDDDNFHNGFVLGAGTEYAITDNLLTGLEYNYIELEDKSFNLPAAGTVEADNSSHSVKLNLKYKF